MDEEIEEIGSSESGEEIGSWIVSYGDLMTVLVVFFIIMMSPQAVVSEEQEQEKETLSSVLGRIKEESKEKKFEDFIEIEQKGNTATITLGNSLLFDTGKASMHKEQRKILDTIVKSMSEIKKTHSFDISGHTDSRKIRSKQFPSNWHLSTARSLTVLESFLKQGFSEENLSSQGYAEFKPLVEEYDEEGNVIKENQDRNRRVEIYIK